MGEAVPAGKAPAGLQAEKATVQTGGKPVPSVAAAPPDGTPVPREAEVRYKEALSAQRRGDFKGGDFSNASSWCSHILVFLTVGAEVSSLFATFRT
jgi:hypothetical protein